MPGDAARCIPLGPPAVGQRRAIRWAAQDIQHRRTLRLDSPAILERASLQTDADLTGVRVIGLDDVGEHRVAVPAAAARTLAQAGGRRVSDRVEALPGGLDEAGEARRFGGGGRTSVVVGDR